MALRRTMARTAGVLAASMERIREVTVRELGVQESVVSFLEDAIKEDLTVPFVARYRRHMTGGMTETQVEAAMERIVEIRAVFAAREKVFKDLKTRELLTDDIGNRLNEATTMAQIEAIYHPFRVQRKTLAARGREKGLDKVSQALIAGRGDDVPLRKLDDEDRKLVKALVVEAISMISPLSKLVEERFAATAAMSVEYSKQGTKAAVKDMSPAEFEEKQRHFATYDGRRFNPARMDAHQVLAVNRGEKLGFLKVTVTGHPGIKREAVAVLERELPDFGWRLKNDQRHRGFVHECWDDAFENHLLPHCVRLLRTELKNRAEKDSIALFRRNLRRELSQRPLRGHVLLAVDPGFGNGCKWAVLAATGDVLAVGKFFLPKQLKGADFGPLQQLCGIIKQHGVTRIAVGNGTASFESESYLRRLVNESPMFKGSNIQVGRCSEHGASVYSASEAAQEELGHLDLLYRSAVSIGRRVLDPLSELVKVPVQSLGVGVYQHDIPERKLLKGLSEATVSTVARIGVDINTASFHVLAKVPGMNDRIAKTIVTFRASSGRIKSRSSLKGVPGVPRSAFEKFIGFIRVPQSAEKLDDTNVHPETYDVTKRLLTKAGIDLQAVKWDEVADKLCSKYDVKRSSGWVSETQVDVEEAKELVPVQPVYVGEDEESVVDISPEKASAIAKEIGADPQQVAQILDALCAPRRDPRDSLPYAGMFKNDNRSLATARPGQKLYGRVENVVAFGAWIDVGMEYSAFMHASQLVDEHGKHINLAPTVVLGPRDTVLCTIEKVNAGASKHRLQVIVTIPRSSIPAAMAVLARPQRRYLERVGDQELPASDAPAAPVQASSRWNNAIGGEAEKVAEPQETRARVGAKRAPIARDQHLRGRDATDRREKEERPARRGHKAESKKKPPQPDDDVLEL